MENYIGGKAREWASEYHADGWSQIVRMGLIDMGDYHLERLTDENADEWDRFNSGSPEGSLFHSLKWKRIMEKGSESRMQYYLLYRGEQAFGIFPLVEHKVRFFQGLSPADDPQRLHAILKDYSDPVAIQHVIGALQSIERDRKPLSFIRLSVSHEETLDLITRYTLLRLPDIGDMVLDLSELPPEELWNSFSAKKGQRKFIRRFDENGFSITEADSPEDLDLFYKYYEENIKHIGGKLQPYSRISALRDSMPDDVRITLLSKGSIVAGGMLMIADRSRRILYTTYLSLNRNLPKTYHPSYYLWWDAINWAWDNRLERVSFGAQRLEEDNPRYRIKYDFGARFQPLHSGMIPLTKTFVMGLKWGQWRSNHRSSVSTVRGVSN